MLTHEEIYAVYDQGPEAVIALIEPLWVVYQWLAGNSTHLPNQVKCPSITPLRGSIAMIPHHIYYQLAIVGLLWLCIMLHYVWPSRDAGVPQPPAAPVPPKFKRTCANEPKPFEGLTHKPPCALHCTSCAGYFPEHHGTIFHGKQAAVELIVRVLAC